MDTKKQLMQKIVSCVGKSEAVKLVSDAHNAEIVANRLGRLEPAATRHIKLTGTVPDLLLRAIERVATVCALTDV
ncbi:MAG: hypothetical protein K9M98_13015 [Cephaloticoccus sp.]|nr:hypothetical protein [Cephaloticoccus sp.]MCF7761414.1 hypothetical protein [Cephaloticoccus sp.]